MTCGLILYPGDRVFWKKGEPGVDCAPICPSPDGRHKDDYRRPWVHGKKELEERRRLKLSTVNEGGELEIEQDFSWRQCHASLRNELVISWSKAAKLGKEFLF